eukprot:COSAG05_NODE_465_length_9537_cov_21.527086_10_plen_142_part_00
MGPDRLPATGAVSAHDDHTRTPPQPQARKNEHGRVRGCKQERRRTWQSGYPAKPLSASNIRQLSQVAPWYLSWHVHSQLPFARLGEEQAPCPLHGSGAQGSSTHSPASTIISFHHEPSLTFSVPEMASRYPAAQVSQVAPM